MTTPGPLSTLPIRGGGGALPPLASGLYSLPQVEQILYVDQGSNSAMAATGSRQRPFHTIQAAMVRAAALVPAADNRILVEVMPGIYTEQVTLLDYVYIAGVNRDACLLRHPITPLSCVWGNAGVWNLTIQALGPGSPVVNVSSPAGGNVTFYDCKFLGTANLDRAVFGGVGDHRIVDCEFEFGGFTCFSKEGAGTAYVSGCLIAGLVVVQAAGGSLYMDTTSIAGRVSHQSAGTLSLRDCAVASSTLSAVTNADATATLILIGNVLSAPANQYSVEATVLLTTLARVSGNQMSQGMNGNVALTRADRFVGVAGDMDWHATLPDAFAAVTFANTTITLLTDVTLTAAITPPSYAIIVNGNGHLILRASAALFTLGAGDSVTFDHCFLWGEVQVDGNGATLILRDCEVLDQIHVVSGDATTLVLITRHSVLNGGLAPHDSPLLIDDADPVIVILNSYLKGLLGSPAIYWNAANLNVKIADSTIMHGTLGANNPFGQVGGLAITYADNHSRVNADPSTFPNFTNSIAAGQRYETIDALADF